MSNNGVQDAGSKLGSAGQVKENGPDKPNSPNGTNTNPITPVDPDDEPQSAITDVTQMLMKLAKTFIVIFPIYVLGYFEFSFSWILVGLATFFWYRRHHGNKSTRLKRVLAFLVHEEKTVRQSLPTSELPPWVSSI